MDTKKLLTKEKDWMFPLYLIVVERINKLCKKYSIKSEFEELVETTFYRMIKLIYENESYYFIPNGEFVESTSMVKHLIGYKDSKYCLDKKKVLSKINETFIYPLVKENELSKKNKKLKKEYDNLDGQYKGLTSEYRIAVNKLKKKTKSKSTPIVMNARDIIDPMFRNKIKNIINENINDCLFKDGKVNYSKLARKIGTSNHTAKKYYNSLYLHN